MGNKKSLPLCHFQELQEKISKTSDSFLLINTLELYEQNCLICGTLTPQEEIDKINECLKFKTKKSIIIYGKNYHDKKIHTKYSQLNQYGLFHIQLYIGGLFEWLLLQEIYGSTLFPTTSQELDLLKYK